MDLSSKEFTLHFRGFEQDDPETVKRFAAFCEANFALSPETFGHADAVVLTQGESSEELEALAEVLREIGARVEVSRECRIEARKALGGPSTQELHRLFAPSAEDSGKASYGPSCPYPPLGRTLYLLTQSDGVFDRRRLRPKGFRAQVPDKEKPAPPRRNRSLEALSALSLGVLALTAAALLVTRTPRTQEDRWQRPLIQLREQSEGTRTDIGAREASPSRSLSANAIASGFNVELKVVSTGRSLSINALTMLPHRELRMKDGSKIKSLVGDPTFLTESSPGEWTGTVLLSVFVDSRGQESHTTIQSRVSVFVTRDNASARAVLKLAELSENQRPSQVSDVSDDAIAHLRTLPTAEFELS